MFRFTIRDVLWPMLVVGMGVLVCTAVAVILYQSRQRGPLPKMIVDQEEAQQKPVEVQLFSTLLDSLPKGKSGIELDHSNLKLEPFEHSLPSELSQFLGKTRAEFLAAAKLTPDLDRLDERDEVVGNIPPGERERWRNIMIMITWSDETGKSDSRPLSIWYRTDTDQIWLIQLPAQKDSDLPSIGPISVRDRFDDVVARLGKPTYTIKGFAWWEVNETTYRVQHYIQPYRHLGVDYEPGEITWIAAYRRDLAPPAYDDGRSWWEKHFDLQEGKQSP